MMQYNIKAIPTTYAGVRFCLFRKNEGSVLDNWREAGNRVQWNAR